MAVMIIPVSNRDALRFYQLHHYTKGLANNVMSFGAYELINGAYELQACCSFGQPISENLRASIFGAQHVDHVKELQRLARSPHCGFSMSWFMSRSIKLYQRARRLKQLSEPWCVISFADDVQGHHGGVYQSMSWLYLGSSTSTQIIYTDQDGRFRHSRQNGINIDKQTASERGWTHSRVKTTKHRYIKVLGTPKQRKRRLNALKLQVMPYPKPDHD